MKTDRPHETSAFHKLTGDTVVDVVDFPAPDVVLVEFANGDRRELSRAIATVYVSRYRAPHVCESGVTTRHLVVGCGIGETGPAADPDQREAFRASLEAHRPWERLLQAAGGERHMPGLAREVIRRARTTGMSTKAAMEQIRSDIVEGRWLP